MPEAAERAGKTPFDFFADLLIETRLGVSCLVHLGIEENVQAILQLMQIPPSQARQFSRDRIARPTAAGLPVCGGPATGQASP